MSVTYADDATAVEHLIQELCRPTGQRRGMASAAQVGNAVTVRSNRRRAPRVAMISTDATVQLGSETVTAVDFSLRGIQFRCVSRQVPGSTVMLRMRWKDENPSVALGRVMWATFEKPSHLATPHYRVGVVFETVDVRVIRAMLQQSGLDQGTRSDVTVV